MDPSVIEAIKRWPDVPTVSGWLSLDERGRWRLHPDGDANDGGLGEAITNERILAFMDRNYAHDSQGRWFFQNGPQRVYVRLDGAPFILRVGSDGASLETHTGLPVNAISAWWLDDDGRLYAATDAGPGMIAGRDLPRVLDDMRLPDGKPAIDQAASLRPGQAMSVQHTTCTGPAPLRRESRAQVARALGFTIAA